MAITLSSVKVSPLTNGYRLVWGLATFDSSYVAGGEVMNLGSYIKSSDSPVVTLNGDDGYVPQHNRGTASAGKVLLYEAGADAAALDEVASTTDLHAVICPFVAIGKAR